MTEAKPKQRKPKLELREPAKPLATPEARQLPADHPVMEIFRQAQAPTTHHPPPTTHHPTSENRSVAPERDFVRVPNSVVRDALTAGLFKGESKKTYDALYQRTRGAIVPRRSIRATLAEVMAWSNVSHNTLKAHLKHLSSVGLLKVNYVRGDNTGAEYEVLTPEETLAPHHPPPTTHHPPSNQNLVPPTTQNLVLGGGGQTIDSIGSSGSDKTSFKTNTERSDDDEAFRPLFAVAKEITGKDAPVAQWREVVEVLIAELRIAAARTTVSSVPAFLAEHLRRRLWKIDRKQAQAEGRELPDESKDSGAEDQATDCPDCLGSGWWYPNGLEKGVLKCRHDRVKKASKEETV
ncbi:MAG TPA: hypothetical protein VGB73_11165 [Pyrinomonadaceae bacterium]|jgi:hypothetical protein